MIQLMKESRLKDLRPRERILLIILICLISLTFIYKTIFEPGSIEINNLKRKREEYIKEVNQLNNVLQSGNSILKEWEEVNREKDLILNKYFSYLDQGEIVFLLKEVLEDEEVEVFDINFHPPREEEIEGITITIMPITIPFRGTYLAIQNLIQALKSINKRIKISSLILNSKDGELKGELGLDLYGIVKQDDRRNLSYLVDLGNGEGKLDPFLPFEDFLNEDIALDDLVDEFYENMDFNEGTINPLQGLPQVKGQVDTSNSKVIINRQEEGEKNKTVILEDFEDEEIYFIPSHEDIRGQISKSTNYKWGDYSLRLEYSILGREDSNRAYIDFLDRNIELKFPPENLGIWVYSYNYSPSSLGLRFLGQAGEKIEIELSKGINWIGWNYIEAKPPMDLSLYPLKLEKIYLETQPNRDDYGVILLDKLEAKYPEENIKTGTSFLYHLVEKNDTLEKISMKYYGTSDKQGLIAKYNDLKSREELRKRKILVIPK